jgi:hypothetical protein
LLNDPISFAPNGGQGGSFGIFELPEAKAGVFGRDLWAGAATSGFFIGALGGLTHVKSRGL